MPKTINYAKCPKCGKKFEMGFNNSWMQSAFGEYSFNQTNHTCEQCGCNFNMKIEKQIVFKTKENKSKEM